jgi:phospholipid transport system substrate-binding protein
MMRITHVASAAVLILLVGGQALAAQPLDTLKDPLNQVIAVLNDPQYKPDSTRQAQKDKIWSIMVPVFDFKEVSKRTLARNWKRFTSAQRTEFSDLFADFLADTYIRQIQGEYQNEKIVFVGEEFLSDTKALAKTMVLREAVEIPVDYSMKKINGAWKVYDIKVEGVSLVKNYRTQFREMLLNGTPEQLIERLKEKLAQRKKNAAGLLPRYAPATA